MGWYGSDRPSYSFGGWLDHKLVQLSLQARGSAIPGCPVLTFRLLTGVWLRSGSHGGALPNLPLSWLCWDAGTGFGLPAGKPTFSLGAQHTRFLCSQSLTLQCEDIAHRACSQQQALDQQSHEYRLRMSEGARCAWGEVGVAAAG